MKIGYTVFFIFKSARLQDKALYRRSLYRLWYCTGGGLFGRTGGRRTAYFKKDPRITYSQKGATASARTIWAAKLRLAEAAKLPVRKGLRPLWQTELATPVYHSSLRT